MKNFKPKIYIDEFPYHIIIALAKKALNLNILGKRVKKSERHKFFFPLTYLNTFEITENIYTCFNNTHIII